MEGEYRHNSEVRTSSDSWTSIADFTNNNLDSSFS